MINGPALPKFVVCPLCYEKFGSITSAHLKKVHNISMSDFRKAFDGYTLQSEQTREDRKVSFRNKNGSKIEKPPKMTKP